MDKVIQKQAGLHRVYLEVETQVVLVLLLPADINFHVKLMREAVTKLQCIMRAMQHIQHPVIILMVQAICVQLIQLEQMAGVRLVIQLVQEVLRHMSHYLHLFQGLLLYRAGRQMENIRHIVVPAVPKPLEVYQVEMLVSKWQVKMAEHR